jgi:hypothetical protein
VHRSLGNNFDFLHLFHCVHFVCVLFVYFPYLAESSFTHTKIQVKRIEIDFLIVVFALKILSVGFDDIESLSSGSFMGVILQLFADAYLVESIEVDMAA